MSDENPLRRAAKRELLCATCVTLSACLFLGCAAKEPPSVSSPPGPAPMVAARPSAEASLTSTSSAKLPSDAPTPTSVDTPTPSPVKVEPVSPEEFQKYIASQRGKVVFVDFWATYCLPCREKFPRTLALAKKYSGEGLTAVSMSMDSPEPSYKKQIFEFLRKQNSQIKNFANRLEDTDAAFAALDIAGGALPHYKIYGRDGKLRNKFGGDPDHPFDETDIERALVAALNEH